LKKGVTGGKKREEGGKVKDREQGGKRSHAFGICFTEKGLAEKELEKGRDEREGMSRRPSCRERLDKRRRGGKPVSPCGKTNGKFLKGKTRMGKSIYKEKSLLDCGEKVLSPGTEDRVFSRT